MRKYKYCDRSDIFKSIIMAIVGLLLMPFAILIIDGIKYIIKYFDTSVINIIGQRSLLLLGRSVTVSFFVAITGTILAFIVAVAIWGRFREKIKYFIILFIVFTIIPPYIHAQAWIFTIDKLNLLIKMFGIMDNNFTGIYASWWVTVMAYIPVISIILLSGLETINSELIEIGLVYNSPLKTFLKVVLTQVFPFNSFVIYYFFLVSQILVYHPYLV